MYPIKTDFENGYKLVAFIADSSNDKKVLHVGIVDSDEVWDQDLVNIDISSSDKGEKFVIELFEDSEYPEPTNKVTINLHHDPTVEDEFEDVDENENDDIEALYTLSYGNEGDEVKEIQTRLKELGYFTGNIGGHYLSLTRAAVESFQTAAGLHADGVLDTITRGRLFAANAPVNEVPITIATTSGQEHAIEMDWWKSDIQKIFAKGVVATITDVDTRLSWQEKRRGGTNHADVQPLTAEDTANLKKAYGGKWSWNRRAIFVTIDGKTYAASMNGMPHGGSSIKDNNFGGHHCIHFTNSRTHCSNKVCPNHQKAIKKAAAAKL